MFNLFRNHLQNQNFSGSCFFSARSPWQFPGTGQNPGHPWPPVVPVVHELTRSVNIASDTSVNQVLNFTYFTRFASDIASELVNQLNQHGSVNISSILLVSLLHMASFKLHTFARTKARSRFRGGYGDENQLWTRIGLSGLRDLLDQ